LKSEKENIESKPYHFKGMEQIEPAMAKVVAQLKKEIESGQYDTLISDDVGGRIPTLVMRAVMKRKNPNQDLRAYFVSGGQYLDPSKNVPDIDRKKELSKYLSRVKPKKRALIVTQYAHSGKSLGHLTEAVRNSGIEDFDVVIAQYEDSTFNSDKIYSNMGENGRVITGERSYSKLNEHHEQLAGVRKTKKQYTPFPKHAVTVANEEGRELSNDEWKEVFGWSDRSNADENMERVNDPKRKEEWQRRAIYP
jgi:hypothetical protein